MPANKRVPDEILVASYRRNGNVHKTALEVGLNHTSVHQRLVRLNVARNVPVFTEDERRRLEREYIVFRDAGKLDALATAMGRQKTSLCRLAKALGLTDPNHARGWRAKWKYMSEEAALAIWETFKDQRAGVRAFCVKKGYDDLGFSRTMRRFFPDEWEIEIEARMPRQTLYRFGRAFEYRVRNELREMGYFVLRSPQSRSPLDLVAIRQGAVLFIQCKRGGALGVTEWNVLLALARSVGAVPLLAECAARRGHILYWRLLEEKDGSKRAQPRGAFQPASYGHGQVDDVAVQPALTFADTSTER
jgi:Holliday junction resolvase